MQNLQNNQFPQFQNLNAFQIDQNIDGFNPEFLNTQMDSQIDGLRQVKQKKAFLHFHLTDLYKLRKIKYTLEFEDPLSKKQVNRAQYIYTLERKEDKVIEELIDKAILDGHKKVYIDLGFHIKQFLVNEIWELTKNDIGVGYKKERKIQIPEESQTYGMMPSLQVNVKPAFQSIPNADPKIVQQSTQKNWYLTPIMQAKFYQSCLTSNWQTDSTINSNLHISKDLNSLEFLQKELHYYIKQDEQVNQFLPQSQDIFNCYSVVGKKPELHISKFITLKLKKQTAQSVLQNQLKQTLKLLLVVGQQNTPDGQIQGKSEHLSDFGIRAISYKQKSQFQGTGEVKSQNEVYFITQDTHESSQLWLPQIYSTTRDAIEWSMNYLIPANTQLVSSGNFIRKQIIKTKDFKEKMLYVYKIKNKLNQNLVIPDKIGFLLGDFQYLSVIHQNCSSEVQKDKKIILGSAFFVSQEKQKLFEANNFYNQQINDALNLLDNILKIKHPSISINQENQKLQQQQNGRDLLKIIFLPNLFASKQVKQNINFSDCIHVFDDEYLLLPRNIIEKRHRVYKTLATSLSFDFFGNKIMEEEPIDQWLFVGIREHIGEIFKRQKCGKSLYKYHMIKRMDKFFDAVSSGAERFSLTSQYVTHFSEIEYGDNLYFWKSQIIMHIMEKLLGETHFFNVLRDFYKNSKPLASIQIFKKVLPQGIKFADIQKNWINSTGCPLLICSSTFNRRNTQVNISIEQHSAIKPILKLKQHIQQNVNQIQNICSNGKILKDVLFNRLYDNKEPLNLNESYSVDKQRKAKQWINYDVKVVVYQTDGREIHEQSQKVKLRCPMTKVQTNMTLQCRPTRGIAKKNPRNLLMEDVSMAVQNQQDNINQRRREEKESYQNENYKEGKIGYYSRNMQNTRLAAEQLHQIMNDNNQWRFDLSDHEYEEYDNVYETKNLFLKNDCPILWIRVDPELETIRRVKVIQSKKNWLFQLIKEKDYIGQIEACKELKKYNDQVVYDILQSVVKNEKYFFKVRKHALKSLQAINVSEFNQNLSREKFFLIKFFNQRNFNDKIGFYKSNDFKNILDYYINTYLIRSLAKSKENKLPIKSDAKQILQESFKDLQKCLTVTGLNIQNIQPQTQNVGGEKSTTVQTFSNDQIMPVVANVSKQQINRVSDKEKDKLVIQDEKSFQSFDFIRVDEVDCITSKKISEILIKLIKENDNSENFFDDCFFIQKLLSNLGKLDDFSIMMEIALEAEKQFNLDNIGNHSQQYSISKGAVKCLFNIKKQIYRFKYFKKPLIYSNENQDSQNQISQKTNQIAFIEQMIQQTENEVLNRFEKKLESIVNNINTPLELRIFIFEKQIKNMFLYASTPFSQNEKISIPTQFLNPLYQILRKIENSMKNLEFKFASLQLQILAQFLEKYYLDKLNFKECLIDNDLKCKIIANILFYMITLQPISILDKQIGIFSKRIYNQIFIGSQLPIPLQFEQSQLNILEQPMQLFLDPQTSLLMKLNPEWLQTEAYQQQQKQLEEQQEMKNQQMNNALPFRQQSEQIGIDGSMMMGVDQFQTQANLSLLNVANIDPASQINQLRGLQNDIIAVNQNDPLLFLKNYQSILAQAQIKSADDINKDLTGQKNQIMQNNMNLNQQLNQEISSVIGLGQSDISQINNSQINIPQLLNQDPYSQLQSNIQKILKEQQNQNDLKLSIQDQYPQGNQDFNQNIIKIDILGDQKKKDFNQAMKQSYEQQDSQMNQEQQKNYKRVTFDQWHEHHQQVAPDEDSNAEINLEYIEEIDDFEDYSFTEIWKQKCWDILYLLYFDPDSGPFMSEFTREALGEIYSDYMDQIKEPINFQMIKQKMIKHEYKMPVEFIKDMNLTFDNCLEYNIEGSLYYKHAKKLKKKLQAQIKTKGLMEHQREIFNQQR